MNMLKSTDVNLTDFNEETDLFYNLLFNIRNPKFTAPDNSTIDIILNHKEYGEINFTASIYDPMPHGRKIWHDLMNGVYGAIAAYVKPDFTQRNMQKLNASIDGEIEKAKNIIFELQCKQFNGNITDAETEYMKDMARYVATVRDSGECTATGYSYNKPPTLEK